MLSYVNDKVHWIYDIAVINSILSVYEGDCNAHSMLELINLNNALGALPNRPPIIMIDIIDN